MTIYQKVLYVFGILRDSIYRRAARTELASLLDTGVTYAIGSMVVHNNVLYRCTTQHTGAWDADHFEEATVDSAVRSGMVAYAVSGVQLNGTALAKTAGVVNVEALTGVSVNGTELSPTAGVVDIEINWGFSEHRFYGSESHALALNSVNSVYINGSSENTMTIPSNSGAFCRQLAICFRDWGSGGSIPIIYDAHTGNQAKIKIGSEWTECNLTDFINSRSGSGTSDFTIRIYEIYPGMFTSTNIS